MNQIAARISKFFSRKRVVVAGDLVADQFLNGTIARVSREAPVFILRHDMTETRPGAAGNAAANIASLGGVAAVVGLVGGDENGRLLLDSLQAAGIDTSGIVRGNELKTTTKVRVLAGQHYAARQQVIRIDYENTSPISNTIRAQLISNFESAARTADAIVLSDYNYGVAEETLFRAASKISHERSIPLLIDSRFRLSEFVGATAATPNQEEVEQMIGSELSHEKCTALLRTLQLDALLVTRGNKGMILFEPDVPPVELPAIGSAEPVDVTGAGDTVIAAFALSLASGMTYAEAAEAANHAGGIVVMKKGTATVSANELIASIAERAETDPMKMPA
jgi:D-glycero-beta-D-manno-heptose-7-phosphate kinase